MTMTTPIGLLGKRRFGPLFAVQFLGAFNDNLFRTAMVLLVIYGIYDDPTREASLSAIAGGLFILPYFLFASIAGSLADLRDKAAMTRTIKSAEIVIMALGATGLWLQSVPLLLATLALTGTQSAFFGPIKYALLPQHLREDEVLGGTGVVQAGTYIGILGGTLLGGALLVRSADGDIDAGVAALGILGVAVAGRVAAAFVPPAPPSEAARGGRVDWNIVRASVRLVREVMAAPRVLIAILAISIFWALGAVLLAQFPPLVKNGLGADENVATLFLALFSLGVASGSLIVNRLLRGAVSARFAPWAALGMGVFLFDLYRRLHGWEAPADLHGVRDFLGQPQGVGVAVDLFGVAMMGGAFVVPLYAFLTTTVDASITARAMAVNNIVNAAMMVVGSIALTFAVQMGVGIIDSLLGVIVVTLVAAWLGWRLRRVTA